MTQSVKEHLKVIGSNIAFIRKSKKINQFVLGKKCHISRATVRLIETGNHDTKILTLSRIARVLQVEISDFYCKNSN